MGQHTSIQPDLVATIEACYRVEQTSEQWLRGVMETLSWLDQGLGIFGFTYTLTQTCELEADPPIALGCPAQIVAALPAAFENGPDFNRAGYLSLDVGAASDVPSFPGSAVDAAARSVGVLDSWAINGRNWNRQNAVVIVNRDVLGAPPPKFAAALARIAVHLAAGIRLQRRLRSAATGADVHAIMSPTGEVQHAEGDARHPLTLRALVRATQAIESARGELRWSDPEKAISAWRGRVATRWTLVDQFERNGERYVVARENEPHTPDPTGLSNRERQVLASAALGRTNKEIAYDLGLADATVRVLLARAARKLGAQHREQAIARFLQADIAQW